MSEGTLFGRLQDYGRSLLDEHEKGHTLSRPTLYGVRLVAHVARELNETQYLERAAALAYTTILSLVPVTALFVLYFKMAGKLDTYSSTLQNWIFKTIVADSAHGVMVYIDQFVANLHSGALGTFGVAGLMFTTYSLLRTVEMSLNSIWKVRTIRSMWVRFQTLCSLLIVVPTTLIASFYLSSRVQELKLFHRFSEMTITGYAMFVGASFFLTTIWLFVVIKLVPNTLVRWRAALGAALVTALFFELARGGFNLYVVKVIPVSKVYGSLGLIPVFLLWIYIIWIIILFGVELSYVIQNYDALEKERKQKRMTNPLSLAIHEEWGLKIVQALVKRFSRGEGAQPAETLANDVGLPTLAVQDHLAVLCQAGLLATTEIEEECQKYLFSRPIESLMVAEIINTFRQKLALPPREDIDKKFIYLR